MRFDHMELSVPVGSLTTTLRERRDDLSYGGLTVHSFSVRYLLPLSFDVHSQEAS